MLLNFRLADIDKIPPWGIDPPSLHWFGLTLGWFWIDIGGQQLFRYSQDILRHWAQEPRPFAPDLPYDEYPVARYWEDLLEMAPSILDPIPDELAALVADADAWGMWRDRAQRWMENSDDDASWDLLDVATRWWSARAWGNGHLSAPPKIWLWRVGSQAHIRWDNHEALLDGVHVWEARRGEVSIPKDELIQAIASFDARFIGEMARRVESIKTHWPRADAAIDLDILEREQKDRSTVRQNALGAISRDFEWDQVRSAIARIDSEMGASD